MSRKAYVPPELATSARDLLLAFGYWCDKHQSLVEQDDWSYAQLVDLFLMECGANGAIAEDGSGAAVDAGGGAVDRATSVGSAGDGAEVIEATRAVLLLRDRLGREWTAGALVAAAETAGSAAIPLASEGAKQLDLRLINFKVVEE